MGSPIKRARFSPLSIQGCQLWVDATDASSITKDTGVKTWADKSGLSRNLTQATTTKQPIYTPAGMNGYPTVNFDGADDHLATAAFAAALSQPYTGLIAFKWTTIGSSGRVIWGGIVTSPEADFLFRQSASGAQMRAYAGTSNTVGVAPVQGTPYVYATVINGASTLMRRNGQQEVSGGSGTATLSGVRIGAYGDGSASFAAVAVGEALVYNRALSISELMLLETYLCRKWGIATA